MSRYVSVTLAVLNMAAIIHRR